MRYMGKLLRQGKRKTFRNYVCQFRMPVFPPGMAGKAQTLRCMTLYELGDKNPGRIVGYHALNSSSGGFCAIWIYCLNRLAFAERMGIPLAINWYASKIYQEPTPYRGTSNLFEYYFQQPYGLSVEEALNSQNVFFDYNSEFLGFDDVFHPSGPKDYKYTPEDIVLLGELNRKYIRFQPWTEKDLAADLDKLFTKERIVGVHARGTDFKLGYKGHPTAISVEKYIQTAKDQMDKYHAEKVFLATDDLDYLDAFKKAFGDRLLYYPDAVRTSNTIWNAEFDQNRKLHRYRLGYEILRDTWTLAHCDTLLCSLSYVGLMAQVLSYSEGLQYSEVIRLDDGVNRTGINLTSQEARNKVRRQWEKEQKKGGQ